MSRARCLPKETSLKRRWIYLCLVATAAASCKPTNLSSAEASKQLTAVHRAEAEEWQTLNVQTAGGLLTMHCGPYPCPERFPSRAWNGGFLANLEQAGLVETRLVRKQASLGEWRAFYSINPTDTGKKYLSLQGQGDTLLVKAQTQEFIGLHVTAVGQPADFLGRKGSVVKYVVETKPTPVGQALRVASGRKEREAFFVVYDNGWKLEPR